MSTNRFINIKIAAKHIVVPMSNGTSRDVAASVKKRPKPGIRKIVSTKTVPVARLARVGPVTVTRAISELRSACVRTARVVEPPLAIAART